MTAKVPFDGGWRHVPSQIATTEGLLYTGVTQVFREGKFDIHLKYSPTTTKESHTASFCRNLLHYTAFKKLTERYKAFLRRNLLHFGDVPHIWSIVFRVALFNHGCFEMSWDATAGLLCLGVKQVHFSGKTGCPLLQSSSSFLTPDPEKGKVT